ncbi:hypothetical protein C2W58_00098 [Bacillus pumilus]|uniref:Uncharacterized protein n=1 Tax=Bacillus pumilus TaxID=1408 RepID=A0AB34QRA8_BACPU|nr:hypothetical protein B4127_1859 [Bacillus pumilus]RAP16747.1 hypothetical protein C2W58_00098 [Bacillus pumilus]
MLVCHILTPHTNAYYTIYISSYFGEPLFQSKKTAVMVQLLSFKMFF